jgi:exodeoxyribonuclease X
MAIRNKVLILDSETTGLSSKDQIIELAYFIPTDDIRTWVDNFFVNNLDINTIAFFHERFNPSVPINPHAQKVHGIGKIKLLGCRKSEEVSIPEDTKYIIAHNAPFDYRMLRKPEGVLLIDTKGIVDTIRKLGLLTNDADEGRDKLDNLIEHYFPEIAKTLCAEYHSAIGDCIKLVLLLSEILRLFPNINTWDDLYNMQSMGKMK